MTTTIPDWIQCVRMLPNLEFGKLVHVKTIISNGKYTSSLCTVHCTKHYGKFSG